METPRSELSSKPVSEHTQINTINKTISKMNIKASKRLTKVTGPHFYKQGLNKEGLNKAAVPDVAVPQITSLSDSLVNEKMMIKQRKQAADDEPVSMTASEKQFTIIRRDDEQMLNH